MAKTFNEMNEKELGKVFQDQLGKLDEGGIEEVASQLGEDRDFLQDELQAIKELASGNKLLNAVQIADAYTRRNLDAKLERNFEDIQRDQRDLSKNIAGGKQGRVDIRKDIAQAEANLTREIRKNTLWDHQLKDSRLKKKTQTIARELESTEIIYWKYNI